MLQDQLCLGKTEAERVPALFVDDKHRLVFVHIEAGGGMVDVEQGVYGFCYGFVCCITHVVV